MDELKFVLKCLCATFFMVMILQVHAGNKTLEGHAHEWLQTSSVSNYLQKVASGAVVFSRNVVKTGSELISKTFGGHGAQKNSRLNVELKRHPQAHVSGHDGKDD